MTKTIVHISGDYPDNYKPEKTRAVSSLVDAVQDTFDQHVYSINRVSASGYDIAQKLIQRPLKPKFNLQMEQVESGVTTIRYDGLPAGLYMATTLSHLADKMGDDIVARGIKPDLIHAHKLTLEGLLAEKLSERIGCPYALSIQVNTDRNILKHRPDLLNTYRRIYQNAAIVFPFSVMGQRICDGWLGKREKPTVLLPCTSIEDKIIPPQVVEPRLASVFNLKDRVNKNASALVMASRVLEFRHRGFEFHLYGGGAPSDESAIDDLVSQHKAAAFSRKGRIPHSLVQSMLNGMCGFALVSKRETFGMVFLEALLAGCPVVYPKDWAIDGFFDEETFALGAPAHDQQEILGAMDKMIVDQKRLKDDLSRWQESGKAAKFQRNGVVRTYRDSVNRLGL